MFEDEPGSLLDAHVWGWCPSCRGKRKATVVFEKSTSLTNDFGVAANSISHRVLECNGCESVYFSRVGRFRNITVDTPNEEEAEPFGPPQEDFYPLVQVREKPTWINDLWEIDPVIAEWYSDIYFCLDNNKNGLAAIAVRTVIDRTLIALGCSETVSFNKKIQWAIENGHILQSEKEIFENLFDAGSAATHRGWRPDYSGIITLIVHLEAIIRRVFIASDDVRKLKTSIPQREIR